MKADLYIGDDVHSIELVAPPRRGDRLFIGDSEEYTIQQVGHDVAKRKLRLVCSKNEYEPTTWAEATEFSEENASESTINLLDDPE